MSLLYIGEDIIADLLDFCSKFGEDGMGKIIFMAETEGGGRPMDEKKEGVKQPEARRPEAARGGSNPDDKRNPGRMDPPETKKDDVDVLDRVIDHLDLDKDEKKDVKKRLDGFKVRVRKEDPEQKDGVVEREVITVAELVGRLKEGLEGFKETGKLNKGITVGMSVIGDLLTKDLDTKEDKKSAAEKGEQTKTEELRGILNRDVFNFDDDKQGGEFMGFLKDAVKLKGEGRLGELDMSRLGRIAGMKSEDAAGMVQAIESDQSALAEDGLPAPAPSEGGGGGQQGGGSGEGGSEGVPGGSEKKKKGMQAKTKLEALAKWLGDRDNRKKIYRNFGMLILLLIAIYIGVGVRAEAEAIEKVFAGH